VSVFRVSSVSLRSHEGALDEQWSAQAIHGICMDMAFRSLTPSFLSGLPWFIDLSLLLLATKHLSILPCNERAGKCETLSIYYFASACIVHTLLMPLSL
jgi:hypothetical protein